MNLTKVLKAKIVEQFRAGHSIAEIAGWYSKTAGQIEDVIREKLNEPPEVIRETGSLGL